MSKKIKTFKILQILNNVSNIFKTAVAVTILSVCSYFHGNFVINSLNITFQTSNVYVIEYVTWFIGLCSIFMISCALATITISIIYFHKGVVSISEIAGKFLKEKITKLYDAKISILK